MTQLTGLNEHTLRAWERRYGAVRPKRGDNGRRVYSRLDVERLRTISMLVERGFSIGRIAALGDRELAELLAEHLSLDQPAASAVQTNTASFESARIADINRNIQGALSRHDLAAIHGELQSARNLLGARSFAVDLVAPLLAHVSKLSSTGHVSIGQEHGLTAIVKAHLASITLSMPPPPIMADHGRTMSFVLATMEGNFQEMSIMIAGVIAATRGATVFYLGPNIPAVALADAVRAFKADQVLIGCAPLPAGVLPVTEVHYLTELDERLPPHCTVWLGGTVPPELKSVPLSRPCKLMGTLDEFDHHLASDGAR